MFARWVSESMGSIIVQERGGDERLCDEWMPRLHDLLCPRENLFHYECRRGVSWQPGWIPLLHIVKDLTLGMVLDASLDLVRFAFFGDEKQRALAAGQDIGTRFVEKVVRDDPSVLTNFANARCIDRIWSPCFVYGGQHDRSFMVFPRLVDGLWQYGHGISPLSDFLDMSTGLDG
jgi:hypothetical protein